jgi:Domain of unknown function (DUF4249)
MRLNFNNIRLISFIFFTIVLFSSCDKTKLFEPNQINEPRIFVKARLDIDSGIAVYLSKTISGGDTFLLENLKIRNATVILEDVNGNRTNVPNIGENVHKLDTTGLGIVAGRKFKLEVSALGFPNIESDWVEIPTMAKVSNVSFAPQSAGSDLARGVIRFEDDAQSEDTYFMKLNGISGSYQPGTMDHTFYTLQICDITNQIYADSDVLIKDDCINGSNQAEFSVRSYLYVNIAETQDRLPADAVLISFGKASPTYYDYIFSLIQPEDIEKGLAEPKPTFTNIKGGFGVFYATNVVVYRVDL